MTDEERFTKELVMELLEDSGYSELGGMIHPQDNASDFPDWLIHAARVITSDIQNYTVAALAFDRVVETEYRLGTVTIPKTHLIKPPAYLSLTYYLAWEQLCVVADVTSDDLADAINFQLNPAAIEAIKMLSPEAAGSFVAAKEIVDTLLDGHIPGLPTQSVH